MNTVLATIWKHRTATMCVLQLMTAQLVTADLVSGTPLKWVLYINGVLTGLIALHNTLKELRAKRAQSQEPTP